MALHGFNRIKIEKLQHVTCMIFRKAVHLSVTLRWARIHEEPYMIKELIIPQDSNNQVEDYGLLQDLQTYQQLKEDTEDSNFFHELPGLS